MHNRAVVENFKRQGVIFIDSLQEAPPGSLVIFSAHGVSPAVRQEAEERNVHVIDATCPLVTKVHLEVHKFVRDGYTIVLIGHKEHDEVDRDDRRGPRQDTGGRDRRGSGGPGRSRSQQGRVPDADDA